MPDLGWRQWPLAVKLTLTVTALVLIALTTVTVLSISREQQAFRSELQEQAELLLNMLEAFTANALFRLDIDAIDDAVQAMARDQTVISSRVYDREGRIVGDAYDKSVTFLLTPDPIGRRLVERGAAVFEWHSDHLLAGRPVVFGRQPIGAISVGLSTTPLEAKIASARNRGLLTAVVVAAIGVLLTLALSRSITGPLRELTGAAKRIGGGDLTQKVTVRSGDEVGSLAATFNAMAAQVRTTLQDLETERDKSERLLLNILPRQIADRLKRQEDVIADAFDEASVLFADIVDFTGFSESKSPEELVKLLNQIFSAFDVLVERHGGLEKIKTIGDGYMVVVGVPIPRRDHAEAIAQMALDMQQEIARFQRNGGAFSLRIGIDTGPVVAGVIGTKKFAYDLWGDTVNTASRMESHGIPGRIQVTAATYERLHDKYEFEERGLVDVKGKGPIRTYLLIGPKDRGKSGVRVRNDRTRFPAATVKQLSPEQNAATRTPAFVGLGVG